MAQPDVEIIVKKPAPWRDYKKGSKTGSGQVITDIFAVGEKYLVFLDTSNSLEWEFDETICLKGEKAAAVAISLLATLNALGLTPRLRRQGLAFIAAALSQAFDDVSDGDGTEHFAVPRAFIDARQTEPARIAYLCTSLSIAAAAAALVWYVGLTTPGASQLSFRVAACLGLGGALLSMLLRFDTLPIGAYSSARYVAVGGAVRLLLGAGFGIALLLLQRAGIVLTIANENPYSTAVFALVAGFSERLVPNLLVGLEGRLNQSGKGKNVS